MENVIINIGIIFTLWVTLYVPVFYHYVWYSYILSGLLCAFVDGVYLLHKQDERLSMKAKQRMIIIGIGIGIFARLMDKYYQINRWDIVKSVSLHLCSRFSSGVRALERLKTTQTAQ